MAVLDEGETTCCYARSDKHWVTDPQGIAWEQFHTLDNIPVFSETAPGCRSRGGARVLRRAARQARGEPSAASSCC